MRLTFSLCLLLLIAGCALTPTDSNQEPALNAKARKFWQHLDRTPGMLGDLGFMTYCVGRDQPLRVIDDGVVLDWRDVLAISGGCVEGWRNVTPDTCEGIGFLLDGRKGVTVRGVPHQSFKVGIYAKNCDNLVIDGCKFEDMFRQRLHSTPDREDTRDWLWPHNNDNREWMTNYGACIVLENCKNCVIRNCSARGTQNGIILDKCEGCQVFNNDFSYCSGWGCALWRSSKNTVAQNRFDYCVRGYSDGVYARGQDSAGILVFEQCCDNTFAYNSATHGGDGFFLYAGHETTQRTGKGGCNRNLVYGNDFSYAVANGIEATFSDGNVFAKNRIIGCDYGIWGGYSYNTLISQNEIADSLTAGIAIEHGHDNWIEGNTFKNDKIGVWLWWDEDKELTGSVYGRSQNTKSERNSVVRNSILDFGVAIRLIESGRTVIRSNEFFRRDDAPAQTMPPFLGLVGLLPETSIEDNQLADLNVDATHATVGQKVKLTRNFVRNKSGDINSVLEVDSLNWPQRQERMDLRREALVRPSPLPGLTKELLGNEIRVPEFYPAFNAGRESMVIGPWGPVEPGFYGELFFGAGAGLHWIVVPPNVQTRVRIMHGNVEVDANPVSPHVTRISVQTRKAPAFEYELRVEFARSIEDELTCPKLPVLELRGMVLGLSWRINFWQWTPAEGSDLPPDWDKLVASPPLKTVTKASLEYNNQDGAPEEGVPADHFATVATTEIELPAGSWKLVLTSDDGARLFVDGEKVIERWDIHGPTDDEYTLTLEKPRRVKLRVEHFENTGWAALALRIERK